MTETDRPKVLIHLVSGHTITAYDDTLPDDDEQAVEEIERRVEGQGHPAWVRFGDVVLFSNRITAIELA